MTESGQQSIIGIPSLLNTEFIKNGIDIEELEKSMSQGVQDIDDTEYEKELSKLSQSLGIDFGGDDIGKSSINIGNADIFSNLGDGDDDDDDEDDDTGDEDTLSELSIGGDGEDSNLNSMFSGGSSNNLSSRAPPPAFSNTAHTTGQPPMIFKPGGDIERKTQEQEKRERIRSALGNIQKDNKIIQGIERYKQEEMKSSLIEQIGGMKQLLEEEGVNVDTIPEVNLNTSFETVQQVHGILNARIMRTRYSTIFEELASIGCIALEYFLDGEREIFGFKPNMKGYNQVAMMKLRRLRYQTSTMVHNKFVDMGIGPTAQILLEMIPSIILHGKSNSDPKGEQGLCSTGEVAKARRDIRDLDEDF